ncbi:MAG: glycoside hydrolase, partial [Saprospiraceae bacterium]|nr:glycoside hydrolase [Saprospiraceae bacterium]
VLELRRVLGPGYELSFAAGGFKSFFDQSVEWDKVMPALNRVNLMSYDLVSGFSTVTGHHTPLYATAKQEASVDAGVQYLKKLGVPAHKIVIGAAFYGRVWEQVQDVNNGLYQSGKFKSFVHYSRFKERLSDKNGFVFYRDSVAHAPFAYSASLKEYATFDDPISLREKTQYARREKLGGIMFWQLTGDSSGELLDAIYNSGKGY